MPPVVAEVVDGEAPLNATLDARLQTDTSGFVHVPVEEVVIGHGLAVDVLADHELAQMGVGREECDLNDVVQGQKRGGEWLVDPAPTAGVQFPAVLS